MHVWFEDLEGLCGRRVVLVREDVEKGGSGDGEGTQEVEIKNDDKRRAERELERLRVIREGKCADATPLAQSCDLFFLLHGLG